MTLVMNRKLLASKNAIVRIANDFLPDFRRPRVLPAPLRHKRQLPASLRPKLGWQPRIDRPRASRMRALEFPAPLQESRQSEQIETLDFGRRALIFVRHVAIRIRRVARSIRRATIFSCRDARFRKHRVDFFEERRKPAQIHLIVPHDSHNRRRRSAAQIVKIKLRNHRRRNVVLAPPPQPRRVEDVTLEFHQPHRSETKFPKRARRMQEIEMRRQLWHSDRARHRKSAF